MNPSYPDASMALVRALGRDLSGCDAVVEEIRSRDWASATFVGSRHELVLSFRGEGAKAAADRFCAELDVQRFNLRGHILVDIVLLAQDPTEEGVRLRLEALTVEDS
jgi:hypothetical protein